MNVSSHKYVIATRPPLLTPAGKFWLGYAIALVTLAAWWMA